MEVREGRLDGDKRGIRGFRVQFCRVGKWVGRRRFGVLADVKIVKGPAHAPNGPEERP